MDLETEQLAIEEEVQNLPFAALLKAKKRIERDENQQNSKKSQAFTRDPQEKRKNKKAPLSRSSKCPVSRLQDIHLEEIRPDGALQRSKHKARDPRFDGLSSKEDKSEAYKKRFAFLDEKAKNEVGILQKELKKSKNKKIGEQERAIIQSEIASLKGQIKQKENLNLVEVAKKSAKEEFKEQHNGVKAKFISKSKETFHLSPKQLWCLGGL